MTRINVSLALLVATAGLAFVATPASAQIAAAIGQPLSSPDLEGGTVSVRVIAGSPANPIVGTDVTLVVNGTPRQARTDSAGRAIFKDLPAGATVKATVLDEDKKEFASSEFTLQDTGFRVLLSTKPFEPGGGGAPFAGGAMPEPRQMSGEPRAEQSDSPGTITVRLTYDDFKDPTPPAGVQVALVGYHADDSIDMHRAATDKDGRATFTGLDLKGETSYFAMAQLPRGTGVDRMISVPAVLDSRSGVRLVLSADKRDSTAPPIDDLARFEKQDHTPDAGKVRVMIDGMPETTARIHLVAMKLGTTGAIQRRVLGDVAPTRAAPDPSDVQGQSSFQPRTDAPAHALHVQVHGGAGVDEPIAGAEIRIVPAKTKDGAPPGPEAGVGVKTPAGGELDLTNDSSESVVAEITINGKELRSQPFDLSRMGGVLDVEAQWESQGKLSAELDVSSAAPDEVVYAESRMRGVIYRSNPFQPVAARGTNVALYVYPRVMFTFSLTSHIDDEFLAVSGRFEITNYAWSPYIGGADGLVIPLPDHFRGAIVAEQDQGDVAVAQGEGFRIGRPIPPGTKQFHAGFSMPVEAGTVHWSLDLPLGTYQSGMEILQTPGMSVQTPPSVKGEVMTAPQGTFFVLPSISILPKQSMVMTISNLPSPPAWRLWAPRIIGVLAIFVMLGGLTFALARTSGARVLNHQRAAQRAKLLDELVELEQSGHGAKNDKRRAQITDELEALWDD